MITQNTRAKYLFGFCCEVKDGKFVRLDPTNTPYWPVARFRGFAAASMLGLIDEIVLFGHHDEPELGAKVIENYASRPQFAHLRQQTKISFVYTEETTKGNAVDMESYRRQRSIDPDDILRMTSDYHRKRAERFAFESGHEVHFEASEDALHLLCKTKAEHTHLREVLRRYYTPATDPGAYARRCTNEDCGVGEVNTRSYVPLAKQPKKTQVA